MTTTTNETPTVARRHYMITAAITMEVDVELESAADFPTEDELRGCLLPTQAEWGVWDENADLIYTVKTWDGDLKFVDILNFEAYPCSSTHPYPA
jgi:hypothetical protein